MKKTFTNSKDFQQLRDHGLIVWNRPVIRKKHQEAQRHFAKVRNAFNTQIENNFLIFDIEVYEHDHTKVLEIGYVIVRFLPTQNLPNLEVASRQHLIIKENLHYKNKDKVPDNRHGFRFGVSKTLRMDRAVRKFSKDINECDYILGHSVQHDEAYLKNIGIDLSVLDKELFDTQVVQTYKESIINSEKYFMRDLSNLLEKYELNYEDSYLHNAGCDAFYITMVFLRQMGYTAEQVNDIIASYEI